MRSKHLQLHVHEADAACCEQVLEKADCEKLGMGLYLGVSECSDLPPKFIHLTYTPPGAPCCARQAPACKVKYFCS